MLVPHWMDKRQIYIYIYFFFLKNKQIYNLYFDYQIKRMGVDKTKEEK